MQIIPLPYTPDTASLFAKLRHLPGAVFLDSCYPQGLGGRFDIISALPAITMTDPQNPFEAVKETLLPYQAEPHPILPFTGGAIGYFSYDLGRTVETLPDRAKHDIQLPDLSVGIYDWVIVADHHEQTLQLVAHHFFEQTAEDIKHIMALGDCHVVANATPRNDGWACQPFTSNFTYEAYQAAFNQVQSHLRAGDCYQINLTQRFETTFTGDTWYAYEKLRRTSPVPFAAYLNLEGGSILSLSPERFLTVGANRQVSTKPIKGTLPRDTNRKNDQALAQQLVNSEKDRAENIMIVDLMRNDLSRTCIPGTVKTPKLCALESFPLVHHLVSTVTGQLDPQYHALDLFKTCFPGGSITGAPKIRAMQIIEQLEPVRRHLYCGSIATIGFDGRLDSNIAIRTLIAEGNRLFCSAGGGIVIESNCEQEYQESLDKVSKLLTALTQPV